jgi:RNase H-fold protein (predicted Holliday junction resolvase)
MSIAQGLLHQIAIVALTAVQEHVDKSQVNKLLEVLNAYDVDTLIVFMTRQVARKERKKEEERRLFGRCTARHLISIIETIVSKAKEYNIDAKVEVRRALGYFKWFYEVFSEPEFRVLDKVLKKYEKYRNVVSCRESLADIRPEAYLELLKVALS